MKISPLIALGLVALSSFAQAAEAEAEALLKAMREAYQGIKAARMQSSTTLFAEGNKLDATFEISFKGPNKVRVTTDKLFGMDVQLKVLSDGKTITVSTPEGKEESPFTVEGLSEGAPMNLEVLCLWDWKRQLSTDDEGNMKGNALKVLKEQKWNDKVWTVLEETAKEQEVFVRYWIDPKTHLIWRTEVFDVEGKEKAMECVVNKFDTEVTFDDSLFDTL